MGKTSRSGLGVGTGSSPQGSLSQGGVDSKVKELTKKHMIDQLTKAGVKFNPNDVLFVTKDKTGQLVWLEKGNKGAGLEHILHGDGRSRGHASDFKKALGLESNQVSGYLQKVITYGSIVSNTIKPIGNRMGFERVYSYEGNYYIVTGIGTNGFIVSAYPHKKGGK